MKDSIYRFTVLGSLALFGFVACSGGGLPTCNMGNKQDTEITTHGDADAASQSDTAVDGEVSGDTIFDAMDVNSETDASADSVNPWDNGGEIPAGAFGAPCQKNTDCDSGFCIETPWGYVCTKTCVDNCPDNWLCKTFEMGGDMISLCTPVGVSLCKPCTRDRQCGEGKCIDVGGGNFCGIDCPENGCPPGYACKESDRVDPFAKGQKVKQCVPVTGSCDCGPANAGEQRVCEKTNKFGRCFGVETCDPKKGWVGCDAKEAEAETCNGKDDNCNGVTDEFVKPPSEQCFIKNKYGQCPGQWTCQGKDGWKCVGKTPKPEVCNNIDDNCDGHTDEGFPDKGNMCSVGQGACTRVGVYQCKQDGSGVECSAKPGKPSQELCNGVDDDCNGKIDENFPDKGHLCSVGQGACARIGVYQCKKDGSGLECNVTPGKPSEELCNGVDDDCNGKTDETWADKLGKSCKVGTGACTANGIYVCSADHKGVQCTGQPGPASTEKCDGVDNDCDGQTDEAGAIGCITYYKDSDKDGFGATGSGKCLCAPSGAYRVTTGGDCNDSNAAIHPGEIKCTKDQDCCAPTGKCIRGYCVHVAGKCTKDSDCPGDYYCENKQCLPYTVHAAPQYLDQCTRRIKVGIFRPTVQCKWVGPPAGDPEPHSKKVIPTPIVVDFNFDNNPKTVKPSIVFPSVYRFGDNPDDYREGWIRIIDGATCKQQYTITAHEVVGADPVAVGDLDGDGRPEIVANSADGGLVAFKFDQAHKKWVLLWHSDSHVGHNYGRWNGPTIVDIDGDGKPEVLEGAWLYDHNGKTLASNLGTKRYSAGQIGVAVDVDHDGKAELITGDGVWGFDAHHKRWVKKSYFTHSGLSDGFVALGDFGNYNVPGVGSKNIPEVVVISDGKVRIQTIAGKIIFGPFDLPGGGTGGAPTVADFDGDGHPEFGVAGRDGYTVFDKDCDKSPVPFGCKAKGILWSMPTQDHSSSLTGSSVFDFEHDGKAEVVYADECFVRVYNGVTGDVLVSWARKSDTWYEYPVVADVDGDGRAEMVIGNNGATSCPSMDPYFRGLRCNQDSDCPSNKAGSCVAGYCRCTQDSDCGPSGDFKCTTPIINTPGQGKVCRTPYKSVQEGLYVFKDRNDNWAASRPIWNQHAYFVTNVKPDGTITKPTDAAKNWSTPGLNNFRQNVQGEVPEQPVADLTVSLGVIGNCDADGKLDVPARVCNRGRQPVNAGVPVVFTLGAPNANSKMQCLVQTKSALSPGDCEQVKCTYTPGDSSITVGVYVVPSINNTTVEECRDFDNFDAHSGVSCTNLM